MYWATGMAIDLEKQGQEKTNIKKKLIANLIWDLIQISDFHEIEK